MERCIGMNRECEYVHNRLCTATVSCPYVVTPSTPALSIERLDELRENVAWALKYGHFIPQTDTADLQRLIEVEIEKQEELK
jgi:hypothetical protein